MTVPSVSFFANRVRRWMAAVCLAGCLQAGAAIEVAGTLLVDLDAADFAEGAEKWPQRGSATGIDGDFAAKGSPTRQMVAGAPAVVFDGDGDHFIGPMTTAALHAPGAKHSVEVWVYQGNVRDQESLVSWGKRWGPDMTFAGFRYGSDPEIGAIARWGSAEMGFVKVPAPGRWHHIAYTYDGKQQSIYVDGKAESTKAVGVLDTHDRLPIHLGVEICGDLRLEGQFTHFSGALGKVRIHSDALTAGQVRRNFIGEKSGFPGTVAKPLQQSPLHRFSFNAAAGVAPNGCIVTDSIGGLSAMVLGAGGKFTGSQIELPGGSSASAAYLDFPNGLISSRESLSIEFWATQTAPQSWCRILSIGTNKAGEILSPGGNFVGSETLTLFGNVGATQVNRFARSAGTYPNGGPDRNPADYPDSDFGVEFHHVITYNKALKEWHWYRNGVLMEVIPDLQGPTTIEDVNVWLGRSEFSPDNNFRGSFNEFRIYNHTLGEGEIYGNFLAGPDKLNLGGGTLALNWQTADPGVHTFHNTAGTNHWNTGPGGPHPNGPGSIATFASALAGDQSIEVDTPVVLGSLNLGTRSLGGSFTLRAEKTGAITMDSGNKIPASITQLPGSPGNFLHVPLTLRTDTEITNQSANPLVLGGPVGGAGTFIKSGNGPVILTGDGGSHGGEVKILAGPLVLGDAGRTGRLGASMFSISDPGQLVFNRGDDIALEATLSGSGSVIHKGRGQLAVGEGGSMKQTGMLDLVDGAGAFTNRGIIDGPVRITADSDVHLAGNSLTRIGGWVNIGSKSGGSLRISDTARLEILGSSHLNIGDVGTGQSVLRMTGGSIFCREFFVGKNEGTAGVVLQSGGEIRKIKSEELLDSRVGGGTAGTHGVWGAWHMTGGKFIDDWNFQIGAFGSGVVEVDGGQMEIAGFLGIGRYEDDPENTSRGVLDVKSGSVTTTAADHLLLIGEDGIGVLNIRGSGTVTCKNRMIVGAGTIDTPGDGTLNLLQGGTLVTGSIGQFNQTEAIGRIHFNGGTLRANTSSDMFLEGLDHVHVAKGGARIDSNGHDIVIRQSLLEPAGRGVVEIPVLEVGSQFVGAPLIDISGGGGTGATAVADLADGEIKSITITHPGNGYTSPPVVTVIGGGTGRGVELGTPVLAENVSGGLVKSGGGMLLLGGENTYTGTTVVGEGTLWLEGVLAGEVEIAAGASLRGVGKAGRTRIARGAVLSAAPGGTMTFRDGLSVQGGLQLELNGAGMGRIAVEGRLELDGATLEINLTGNRSGSPVHLIASYGTLSGEFDVIGDLPAGYTIEYHHNGENQIALVATTAGNDAD